MVVNGWHGLNCVAMVVMGDGWEWFEQGLRGMDGGEWVKGGNKAGKGKRKCYWRVDRVQCERVVVGAEMIGGRMPRVIQMVTREAQRWKGRWWRSEELRLDGVEGVEEKLQGPKRQTVGSRRGMQSAQAM